MKTHDEIRAELQAAYKALEAAQRAEMRADKKAREASDRTDACERRVRDLTNERTYILAAAKAGAA